MVITALCQLTLLGLASAQVVKRPLLNSVDELLPKIDAVLPAAQKYSLTKWTTAEGKYFNRLLSSSNRATSQRLYASCSVE